MSNTSGKGNPHQQTTVCLVLICHIILELLFYYAVRHHPFDIQWTKLLVHVAEMRSSNTCHSKFYTAIQSAGKRRLTAPPIPAHMSVWYGYMNQALYPVKCFISNYAINSGSRFSLCIEVRCTLDFSRTGHEIGRWIRSNDLKTTSGIRLHDIAIREVPNPLELHPRRVYSIDDGL